MVNASHTIVCGDLHGKFEVVEAVLAQNCPVVFLGDFVDSYDRTLEDQIKCVDLVIQAHKEGRARFILGNHEWGYDRQEHKNGGTKTKTKLLLGVNDRLRYLIRNSDAAIRLVDDIVVTHAGIDQELWEHLGLALDTVEEQAMPLLHREMTPWHLIGKCRGGWGDIGGPLWLDWTEEFVPMPGVRQIVGHTRTVGVPHNFVQTINQGIRYSDNGDACIDCLDETPTVVTVSSDGEITPLVLEVK